LFFKRIEIIFFILSQNDPVDVWTSHCLALGFVDDHFIKIRDHELSAFGFKLKDDWYESVALELIFYLPSALFSFMYRTHLFFFEA
jgi:hypothetical protein